MGRYADIDAMCDGMVFAIHAIAREVLEVMNQETKKEGDLAYKEFGDYQRSAIEALFHESVQQFYDAYSPTYYARSYGLNDLLEMHTDDFGMVTYDTAEDLVNEDNLHRDGNGGSLYDKVFVRGWHGGAESGPGHPAPGVPYYRGLGSRGLYAYWSRPAVRTEPAFRIFQRSLSAAENGEIASQFKRISDKHNDIAMERVRKEADRISRKYYG